MCFSWKNWSSVTKIWFLTKTKSPKIVEYRIEVEPSLFWNEEPASQSVFSPLIKIHHQKEFLYFKLDCTPNTSKIIQPETRPKTFSSSGTNCTEPQTYRAWIRRWEEIIPLSADTLKRAGSLLVSGKCVGLITPAHCLSRLQITASYVIGIQYIRTRLSQLPSNVQFDLILFDSLFIRSAVQFRESYFATLIGNFCIEQCISYRTCCSCLKFVTYLMKTLYKPSMFLPSGSSG